MENWQTFAANSALQAEELAENVCYIARAMRALAGVENLQTAAQCSAVLGAHRELARAISETGLEISYIAGRFQGAKEAPEE